jgi:hypothetical protein
MRPILIACLLFAACGNVKGTDVEPDGGLAGTDGDSGSSGDATPGCVGEAGCACAADSECTSTVCDLDAGSCAAAADILYATEAGTDTDLCTQDDPCSLARAIAIANGDAASSTIRMFPGTYRAPLQGVLTPIEIVGTGATLVGQLSPAADIINTRHRLAIRGLTIDFTRGGGLCDGSSVGGGGTLALSDLTTTTEVHTNALRLRSCKLELRRVTIASSIQLDHRGSLDADRTLFRGAVGSPQKFIVTHADYVTVQITNAIFDNFTLDWWQALDEPRVDNNLTVSHSTFYRSSIACFEQHEERSPPGRFDSSIFEMTDVDTNQDQLTACTFARNILGAGTHNIPTVENARVDPKLVDVAQHDFQLQAGSPAIDAASASVLVTDHDYAGLPRPQGAAKDIGAFERAP